MAVLLGRGSANAFAKECDVDPKTIRKAIEGKVPTTDILEKITDGRSSIGWLLGEINQGGPFGNITGDNNVQSGNITAGGDVVQENILAQRLGPDLIKLAELIAECESPLRIRAMIAEYEEKKKIG